MSKFTKQVKRALTFAVAGTTIAWSVGLMGLPMALGAAKAGDLIKLQCAAGARVDDPCRTVYYYGADGNRYVFPDEKTYKTWYSDFTGVVTIPKAEMESYFIAGNVTYRPGVKMIKVMTDPAVYVVSKGGVLTQIATEADARTLYGNVWATSVNDLADSFFINYRVTTEADGRTRKKITAAEYDKAAQTAGSPDIGTDKGLIAGATPTPTPVVGAAATLQYALASDTPASGIVAQNAIRVPFTYVNFTASGDGDATIDQIVVKRAGGVSQDGAFAGILLWDVDTDARISTVAHTLSTDHTATFNEDIVVKAGTTRKIMIAGNMASSLTNYAGEVPTLGIATITMTGGTTLVGPTLPLYGNYQTLNNTLTIGTLTITTGADNPSDSTQKIGTTDFIFTGLRVTAGSAEKIDITHMTFNQGGTAADSDVQNLDLMVDGTVVATVKQASNKNLDFDLRANPVVIDKGKTKQIDLRGDIVNGSSRTIRWDIKKQDDVIAKGETYGFSPTPSFPNTSEPYFNTGATIAINRGTVAVTATAAVVNSNVAEDTKEATLGKFDFDVRGEPLSFESVGINFLLTTSTVGARITDITAVKLVDSAGKVVGGPIDPVAPTYYDYADSTEHGTATITDNFILPAGVTTLTVKADLSADFAANDNIRARIVPKNMIVKGQDTGETLVAADKTPSGMQTSAIYTVKTASLAVSVSNTPVSQTVVGGTQNFTFANFRVDASDSGEDVKITQMKAELVTTVAAPNAFSNWRILDGSTVLTTSSSPDPTGATAGGATTTFIFTNPLIITKGTVKTLSVQASVQSSATSGTIRVGLPTEHATGLQFSSTGKDSGDTTTVTLSVANGQTMTLSSGGTLTVAALTSNYPAGLLPANTNGLEVGVFRMTSVREPIRIEQIYLTATSTRNLTTSNVKSAFNQIRAIHLYDGATEITPSVGVQPTTTSAHENRTVLIDITSNPIIVNTDSAKDILVKVDTSAVTRYPQASNGDPGQGFTLSLNGATDLTAKGAQSGTTLGASSITLSGASLNAWSVMGSVPTVTTYADLATSEKIGASGTLPKLAAGSQKEIYRFKVAADSAGDVYLFSVAIGTDMQKATVTNPFISLADTGAQVAATTTAMLDATTSTARLYRSWNFIFTSDGLAPTNTTYSPYRLPLGTSKLFVMKGDIVCWSDNGCGTVTPSGSLGVAFLGDPDFPTTYPESAVALYGTGGNKNHFIWSDASIMGPVGVASGTATTSEQWFNGYRVRSAVSALGRLQATTTDVTFNP
ncbi:MAG: hypothetical protein PHI63_04180 [Patescibacteria group bacterium]|nr:hypothetical protein [Patescibacteria group bacterium]